jgi:glycosyltransferase involved in cell wall biosynthesis
VQLFLKRLLIFLKAVSVARSLEDSGIDLLHTHFAWLPGAATWICARLLGKPFTVTVHAYDIYSHKNDLLPLVTREATHVIAISEFNRSQVAAVGMRPANTISVIHCGINLAQFEKQREGQPTSLVGGPLRILSVGSLVPKKGHHRLIAACHILSERGFSFTCRIIGDGPQEQSLREQVRAYGLQHQIELLGARLHPEIIEAYRHHDLFVLASVVAPDGDRDGIPVVLMEAGTMGLPIIATPLSGIPELIQHRVTGWLVPPDDATGLADAIATLAADPGMRRRLGETARALVQDRFDIQRTASQLVAVWQHVCEQSPCSCDAA